MSATLTAASSATKSTAPSIWASVTTHRELVENLVMRDVKTRYKQSVLGYAWAVFNPLIVALTYWLVFGVVLHQNKLVAIPYTVYVYFGLLVWNLYSVGLTTATESLVSHISLITKVYFPREVFPVSSVLSKVFDFFFGLVGMIPLLFLFHVAPSPKIILAILLLPIPLLFTIGLGMLCASANLFFRDIRYLVTMILGLGAFAIPNMYPLSQIPARFLPIYLTNPIATSTEVMRRLTFPQTGPVGPLLPYLALSAVISVVTFILGYIIFKRNEPRFAEFV